MANKSTGSKGAAGKDKATKPAPKPTGAANADAGNEALKKGNAPADAAEKPEGAASAAGAVSDTGAGKKTTTQSIRGLEVISTQDGFRRAGFAWTKQPTFIALDDLDEKEIDLICREPMLTVREVEVDADAMIARASK